MTVVVTVAVTAHQVFKEHNEKFGIESLYRWGFCSIVNVAFSTDLYHP
jgi:hypothetical protein